MVKRQSAHWAMSYRLRYGLISDKALARHLPESKMTRTALAPRIETQRPQYRSGGDMRKRRRRLDSRQRFPQVRAWLAAPASLPGLAYQMGYLTNRVRTNARNQDLVLIRIDTVRQ